MSADELMKQDIAKYLVFLHRFQYEHQRNRHDPSKFHVCTHFVDGRAINEFALAQNFSQDPNLHHRVSRRMSLPKQATPGLLAVVATACSEWPWKLALAS